MPVKSKNGKIVLDVFLLAVFLELVYAFVPFIRVLPMYVRMAWRVMPLILTILCVFFRRNSKLIFYMLILLAFSVFIAVVRISSNANGTATSYVEIIVGSMIYWISILQSIYMMEFVNYRDIKSINGYLKGLILISSFTTLVGNILTPGVSRQLMHLEEATPVYIRNIGGYGFIYGAMFIVPWLINLYQKEKNKRILIVVLFTIISVIFSQFFAAICILIIGFLSVFNFKNTKRLVFACLLVSVLSFFLQDIFVYFLIFIEKAAHVRGLNILIERISGFRNVISGEQASGDIYARLYLYRISINHFIDNPLFGLVGKIGIMNKSNITPYQLIVAGQGTDVSVGQHSDIIDLIGGGGLFAFIPFLILILKYYKRIYDLAIGKMKVIVVLTAISYFAYGLFDHSFSNFEVGLAAFFLPTVFIMSSREFDDGISTQHI